MSQRPEIPHKFGGERDSFFHWLSQNIPPDFSGIYLNRTQIHPNCSKIRDSKPCLLGGAKNLCLPQLTGQSAFRRFTLIIYVYIHIHFSVSTYLIGEYWLAVLYEEQQNLWSTSLKNWVDNVLLFNFQSSENVFVLRLWSLLRIMILIFDLSIFFVKLLQGLIIKVKSKLTFYTSPYLLFKKMLKVEIEDLKNIRYLYKIDNR